MNKKQIALIEKQIALIMIFSGFHFAVALLCLCFIDPFGVIIVFFGVPSAAAGSTAIGAGLCKFWRSRRLGQLPLLLLVTLLFYGEVVARVVYFYEWFEWLPAYFPLGAIQYGCCLLTLYLVRRRYDKIENNM